MKRALTFGLLMLLAIGCTAQPPANSDESSRSPDASTTSSESNIDAAEPSIEPSVSTDATTNNASGTPYVSKTADFQFTYPEDYFLDNPLETDRSDDAVETVEIWQQSDYEDIQSRLEERTELPPNISVKVYSNPDQLPLTNWKQDLSSDDDRPLTLDGQDAIAYTSTGLYEHDNVVVGTPDGEFVIHFSVGYFDASDPMRQDFEAIVSSIVFSD